MFTRSSRSLAIAAALALTTFAASAAPVSVAKPVTVGDFAVKLSRALGYPTEDQEAAATNLRMAGVHVDPDLRTPLTEGRAAEIMREIGVPAQASGDPAAAMTPGKADQAASSAALSMSMQPDAVSPESVPTQCSGFNDRKTCYQCCSGVLMPISKYPLRVVLICGLLCAKLFPSPSVWTPAGVR